jgi:2,4-dienoyl-CoA reductase-like NADH-dependent reductase (Old Yellow Enzyme family)
MEYAHQNDTKVIMQLVYGSKAHNHSTKTEIWTPTALQNSKTGIWSKEMTKADIQEIVKLFTDAASRAKAAGLDGVQVHCAHGFLLSQFLSPHLNQRTDEYGGSVENRVRIIKEVITSIQENVGKEYPIFVKLNCCDFVEGGLVIEESVEVAKILSDLGIDGIEVSANSPAKALSAGVSYFKEYAMSIADAVTCSVISTGGNRDLNTMKEIFTTTKIQFFGISRGLVSNPNLIKQWQAGDINAFTCVSCTDYRCYHVDGKHCIVHK